MNIDNYYPPTEPVELLPSFILYADILGFKSVIQKFEKLEDLPKINEITTKLNRILLFEKKSLQGTSDIFKGHIKVFSDNYLYWVPLRDPSDGRSQILIPIEDFAQFQFSMACNGFFLRGGASIGYGLVNDHMAIGPALLTAIEIEESSPKYPCIVIDCSLEKRLKKYIDNHWPGYHRVIKYFLISSDGRWIINYLEQFWDMISIDLTEGKDFYEDNYSRLSFIHEIIERYSYWIKDHKENIEEKLADDLLKPEIKANYLWLADYHNFYFSRALSVLGEKKNEFLIEKEKDFEFQYYQKPEFSF